MSRRFLLRVAAYTLGFYIALLLLRGFTFFVSHLPPGYVHLDWAVIGLTYLEQVMVFPRWLLRHLWFSETTPAVLNWVLGFLNSAAWGLLYACFKRLREPQGVDGAQPPVIER